MSKRPPSAAPQAWPEMAGSYRLENGVLTLVERCLDEDPPSADAYPLALPPCPLPESTSS